MRKTCIKCGECKELTEFHKNSSYTDKHDSRCKTCKKLLGKKYYETNKEVILIKQRIIWHKNSTKNLERKKEYVKKNIVAVKARNSSWKKSNRIKCAASRAKYRATLAHATPKWLTKAHLLEIENYYKEAKLLSEKYGVKYHVDHIEPLNGESSIGLHVPWNLQVIPHYINESKANKLITKQTETLMSYNN